MKLKRLKTRVNPSTHLAAKKGEFHRYCYHAADMIKRANSLKPPILDMNTALADMHRISHELFGRTFFYARFNEVHVNQPSIASVEDFNRALQKRLELYGLGTQGEVVYDPITCKLEFFYREIGAIPYNDDLTKVVDI